MVKIWVLTQSDQLSSKAVPKKVIPSMPITLSIWILSGTMVGNYFISPKLQAGCKYFINSIDSKITLNAELENNSSFFLPSQIVITIFSNSLSEVLQ